MVIRKNKKYRIISREKYFKKKYGKANPIIRIEGNANRVFKEYWLGMIKGNSTVLCFIESVLLSNFKNLNKVYYGKIKLNGKSGVEFGELVHRNELSE